MNSDEHLYLKLMEECAEVQQRVSKLLQFGPKEQQSAVPGNNWERLQEEINDLISVVHLLGYSMPSPGAIRAKKKKIEKYLRYSRSLGRVS